jgi:hypothetical protein
VPESADADFADKVKEIAEEVFGRKEFSHYTTYQGLRVRRACTHDRQGGRGRRRGDGAATPEPFALPPYMEMLISHWLCSTA